MKAIMALIFCLICFSLHAKNIRSQPHLPKEKKIALLFLTRSDLNHTQLWKEWIDPKKYSIYNHSKDSVKDPWFQQFGLVKKQPTAWSYILLAQQALLKEALKDPSNYKFVFLSESCVPLRSDNQVYDILTADNSSYMRWYDIWWKGDPARTLTEFPKEHHWGNHTWIILNRKHADMMAKDNYWLPLAFGHLVGDESYPSTFFSMKGLLHEFKNELTTYVDWNRGTPYVFRESSPENYDLLMDARCHSQGPFGPRRCLFARKFAPEFPDDIIKLIQAQGQ